MRCTIPFAPVALVTAVLAVGAARPAAAQEQISFLVDQTQSSATFTLSALSASDSDTSRIGGTSTLMLNPGTAPFSAAQVETLQLTLLDDLSLSLNLILASVQGSAPAGAIGLAMDESGAGPAAVVDSGGLFDQPGNQLSFSGQVEATITPLIGQPTHEVVDLSTVDVPLVDFTDFSLSQAGDVITLHAPLSVATVVPVEVGTSTIDVNVEVTGQLVAFGTAIPGPLGLRWDGTTGAWGSAHWDTGAQLVGPVSGAAMTVAAGAVAVDADYAASAAASLDVGGALLEIDPSGALSVTGAVHVSGGGLLAIDGALTSGDLLTEAGSTLSGTGSIAAGQVVVGGTLSPGQQAAVLPALAAAQLAVPHADQPVPEPGTLLLLGIAALAFLAGRGRRVL